MSIYRVYTGCYVLQENVFRIYHSLPEREYRGKDIEGMDEDDILNYIIRDCGGDVKRTVEWRDFPFSIDGKESGWEIVSIFFNNEADWERWKEYERASLETEWAVPRFRPYFILRKEVRGE